jgi:hypothetical protein
VPSNLGSERTEAVRPWLNSSSGVGLIVAGMANALLETVVAGDLSYAGPLAGVGRGLPLLHVFEPG